MEKEFYKEIAKMKQILRRGWLLQKVPGRVESDAEHTFSMIMLALEIMAKNDTKLDQLKVLKMIAYHELGEIDFGDTAPEDNISPDYKHRKEEECLIRLSKTYNIPEMLEIWEEFEQGKTAEAKFVKMIDKADPVMQVYEYDKAYNMPNAVEEFLQNNGKYYNKFKKYKR